MSRVQDCPFSHFFTLILTVGQTYTFQRISGAHPFAIMDNSAAAFMTGTNGSPFGITSVTSEDGRATILMPHPKRVFRAAQLSWAPKSWGEDSPWMRFFRNARIFVG